MLITLTLGGSSRQIFAIQKLFITLPSPPHNGQFLRHIEES
jgi:hypothetical protein